MDNWKIYIFRQKPIFGRFFAEEITVCCTVHLSMIHKTREDLRENLSCKSEIIPPSLHQIK